MSDDKTTAPPPKNGGSASKLRSPLWVWPGAIVLGVLLYFGISY